MSLYDLPTISHPSPGTDVDICAWQPTVSNTCNHAASRYRTDNAMHVAAFLLASAPRKCHATIPSPKTAPLYR